MTLKSLFVTAAVSVLAGLPAASWAQAGRLAMLRHEFAPSSAADRPVLVVAHRGCWTETAENSLAAIEACIALGVDVVELDARRTADGALVLMHDATVDRMTNGHGRVEDLTLAQISALRLRAGSGGPAAPLTEAAPPTFEAAMRAAKGRILVNLDAKADVYDDAFAVLERTGTIDQVIMKRRVAAGDPALNGQPPFDRVLAMPIVDQAAGSADALLAGQIGPGAAAVETIFTDLNYLAAVRRDTAADGTRIWVNTLRPEHAAGLQDQGARLDPDGVWGRLIAMGVTIIQTDEPAALIAYVEEMGRRPAVKPMAHD